MSDRFRRTEEQKPHLPPRSDDLILGGVYAEKKESFLHRYGKKIAGSIGCAVLVSVIMHLKYVHFIVLWVCQIIIFIFGRPAGAEKLDRLEEKAKQTYEKTADKAKEVAHQHAEDKAAGKPGPLGGIGGKLKEQAHAVKEVGAKVEQKVEQKADAVGAKIADTGHEVAGALKGSVVRAKDAVGGGMANASEALQARKEAQEKALQARKEAEEKAMRDVLIVRARKVGLTIDEKWSVTRLHAEVNDAEATAWRKRYNAQCTFCHRPMRISERMKHERFKCPLCQQIITAGAARAMGPPPMHFKR